MPRVAPALVAFVLVSWGTATTARAQTTRPTGGAVEASATAPLVASGGDAALATDAALVGDAGAASTVALAGDAGFATDAALADDVALASNSALAPVANPEAPASPFAPAAPTSPVAAAPANAPVAAVLPAVALAPGGIDDAEVARRIRWIQRELDRGNAWANAWYFGWVSLQSTLVIGQGVLALAVSEEGFRNNMLVSVGIGVAGLAPLLISPMRAAFAARRLRALSEGTPEQRRAKLAQAERILREAGHGEDFGRSWLIHVGSAALAAASGLLLWLWLDQPIQAITSTAINAVGGELQIWSQPIGASDAWRAYASATRDGGSIAGVASPPWRIAFGLRPGGLSLRVAF